MNYKTIVSLAALALLTFTASTVNAEGIDRVELNKGRPELRLKSLNRLSILWSSPISLCLWALTALMLALPGIRWWRARRSAQLANA